MLRLVPDAFNGKLQTGNIMQTTPEKKFIIFRWIDATSDAGGIVAAVCMLAVTLIITYEVFARYLFSAPTTWVAEISIYLWMALGLLGAAYALKNNTHFAITIVVDRLSAKNRRRLKILTHTMGIAYSLVFLLKGAEMVKFSYDIKDASTGLLQFPLWIPWTLIPLSGLLLALQFINKLAEEVANQDAH
jgi:C4-dicarboxylate transporter, DctQ subunit